MVTALKQTVVVQPGGLIEIRAPELAAGTEAEVIVLVESKPNLGGVTEADRDAAVLEERRRALRAIQRLMDPYADAFKGPRFTRDELHERR
jgi:hypothetical protein